MIAVSLDGAQLDVAPVSDTPEGMLPDNISCLCCSSVNSGDQ